MGGFSCVFESYIKYNFHVGLTVWALAHITALDFGLNLHFIHQLIFFMAPFLGYNFIKYHLLYWNITINKSFKINLLLGFFLLCILTSGGVIFFLPLSSQLLFFFTLLLGLLYCLPLPGFKINFRGFKGVKIHLVALSWVLMTVFLPLTLEGVSLTEFSLMYGFQRYLFVIAASLPFEIRDLKLDHPNLSTWPQIWGVKNTKIFGFVLLMFFLFLEVLFNFSSCFEITTIIAIILMVFIFISKKDQPKYFSSFWVEGIPILWLFLKKILL